MWPDAISTLIPEVDYLCVPRKEMTPRKWFKSQEDFCIVPREEYASFLKEYQTDSFGINAYHLPTPSTPSSIKKIVRRLKPFNEEINKISNYQVLNIEILEKALSEG